jgi:hypothetical protein
MGGRPCGLAETTPQPGMALAGRARQPLARALMVPWTHARPTGQVLGRGQLVHVHADFGDEIRGGYRFNPWDGRAQGHGVLVGTNLLVDLGVQLRELGFQTLELLPQHAPHPALVVCHAPLAREWPLGKCGAEATSREIGECGRVLFARQELRQYGPPGHTSPVTGDRRQLDIGVLKDLLQTVSDRRVVLS